MRHEVNIWLRSRANIRVLEKDLVYRFLVFLIAITDERRSRSW